MSQPGRHHKRRACARGYGGTSLARALALWASGLAPEGLCSVCLLWFRKCSACPAGPCGVDVVALGI